MLRGDYFERNKTLAVRQVRVSLMAQLYLAEVL
jgi:hypothetical protein